MNFSKIKLKKLPNYPTNPMSTTYLELLTLNIVILNLMRVMKLHTRKKVHAHEKNFTLQNSYFSTLIGSVFASLDIGMSVNIEMT